MDKVTNAREQMMKEIDALSEFSWVVNDVHRLLAKNFDARAKSIGLTRSQWRVLMHLLHSDGRTQTELADLVQIEKAPLGRMLDKLESSGWIRRQLDQKDRRIRRVYATEQLEPYVPALRETTRQVLDDAISGLSQDEAGFLLACLKKVKTSLDGDAKPPTAG